MSQKLCAIIQIPFWRESFKGRSEIAEFDYQDPGHDFLLNARKPQVFHARPTLARQLIKDLDRVLQAVTRPTIERARRASPEVVATVATKV